MPQTRNPGCTEIRIQKPFSPMESITMKSLATLFVISGILLFTATARAADVNADAAQALAKKSGCLKCHAVDRKKDAPSYKEIAAKYKGKADAADKLYKHLTTSPKVKVDGKEETHDGLKTKDDKEVRNVVQWILGR